MTTAPNGIQGKFFVLFFLTPAHTKVFHHRKANLTNPGGPLREIKFVPNKFDEPRGPPVRFLLIFFLTPSRTNTLGPPLRFRYFSPLETTIVPNEFHQPLEPPVRFLENIYIYILTPGDYPERIESHEPRGALRVNFFNPWGPPEWTERPKRISRTPGGPREFLKNLLPRGTTGMHRTAANPTNRGGPREIFGNVYFSQKERKGTGHGNGDAP